MRRIYFKRRKILDAGGKFIVPFPVPRIIDKSGNFTLNGKMNFIEEELYKKICISMPILCVDVLLTFEGKFLLVKRNESPLKNILGTGGRVFHKEKLKDALSRILKRETGVNLKETDNVLSIIGITEMIFENSKLSNSTYHTPAIIYQIKLKNRPNISLDNTSSEYIWSDKIPELLQKNLTKI